MKLKNRGIYWSNFGSAAKKDLEMIDLGLSHISRMKISRLSDRKQFTPGGRLSAWPQSRSPAVTSGLFSRPSPPLMASRAFKQIKNSLMSRMTTNRCCQLGTRPLPEEWRRRPTDLGLERGCQGCRGDWASISLSMQIQGSNLHRENVITQVGTGPEPQGLGWESAKGFFGI